MIKHIVMYKLKNPAKDKQQLVDTFMSMKGKIEVLKDIVSGFDVVGSARSFDVCLVSTFDSLEDLEIYRNHEVHLPIVDYVKGIVEKSHSVDFEF